MTTDGRLPFDEAPSPPGDRPALPDAASRAFAVDPTRNVVLEASAGTGKTRVLVDRYVNLLREGVDPASVLAITFTRKAAAEMRERIIGRLRAMAATGELTKSRWNELRARLGDIAISTIDAFCLALLREFPLEADVDPGFDLADETQVPRLIAESLDATLRICRGLAQTHEEVALVFAQLGEPRLRGGLSMLLERRLVTPEVLRRFLAAGPKDLTLAAVCARTAQALFDALALTGGGLTGFLADGPVNDPAFVALGEDLRRLRESLVRGEAVPPPRLRTVFDSLRDLVFTGSGTVRKRAPGKAADYESAQAKQRTLERVQTLAGPLEQATRAFRRDLNVLLARGVRRIYAVAETTYLRTLDAHAVLDFTEVLSRALRLLEQMEEFARSRWRLESRYHHVLVDEFQDTNRAQWDLVQLLIQSWGEGFGLTSTGPLPPTVFIVGDRKQSIYSFRDADVRVLNEAARTIAGLRPDDEPRRAISVSFRAVPALLSFVNDLFSAIPPVSREDGFRYGETDRFPVAHDEATRGALGLVVSEDVDGCAEAVAAEIARLIREGITVRDRDTGVPRGVEAGDIAILFRTRETHRAYERALERRQIRSYVYKGLGFFESDEIVDVLALLRYLADPRSDLRAAAFLRSRFVRLSDPAIGRLAPRIAGALLRADAGDERTTDLDEDDRRVLDLTRTAVRAWLDLVDRIPPAELLDHVLAETAYAFELRRAALAAGAREPEEAARAGAPHPEPRLRDARPGRRPPRRPLDGRRVERHHRCGRRSEPDDRARRQGPRVPGRLRGEPGQGVGRPAACDPARHRRWRRQPVGRRRRGRSRARRGAQGARARRDQAAALRRRDAGPRPAVPVDDRSPGWPDRLGPWQPRPRAVGGRPAAVRPGGDGRPRCLVERSGWTPPSLPRVHAGVRGADRHRGRAAHRGAHTDRPHTARRCGRDRTAAGDDVPRRPRPGRGVGTVAGQTVRSRRRVPGDRHARPPPAAVRRHLR